MRLGQPVHVARLVETAAGPRQHRAKVDRGDAERRGGLGEHPLRPLQIEPFAVAEIDIARIDLEIGGATHLNVGRDQQQQEPDSVRFGDSPHPLQPSRSIARFAATSGPRPARKAPSCAKLASAGSGLPNTRSKASFAAPRDASVER